MANVIRRGAPTRSRVPVRIEGSKGAAGITIRREDGGGIGKKRRGNPTLAGKGRKRLAVISAQGLSAHFPPL